jgi:hypothetical protein
MENICRSCALHPGSHSFREIARENDIIYFYTKPDEAILYNDTKGILEHYNNMLASVKGAKWSWIFDMDNFGLKHLMNPYLCYQIAMAVGKYNDTLQQIKIINPNIFLTQLLVLVMPFISSIMRSKIKTIKNVKETEELSEIIKKKLIEKLV